MYVYRPFLSIDTGSEDSQKALIFFKTIFLFIGFLSIANNECLENRNFLCDKNAKVVQSFQRQLLP